MRNRYTLYLVIIALLNAPVLLLLSKAATEVGLNFVPVGILGSSRCLKGNVRVVHNFSACMESPVLSGLQIKVIQPPPTKNQSTI